MKLSGLNRILKTPIRDRYDYKKRPNTLTGAFSSTLLKDWNDTFHKTNIKA
jgi:hypothetical protein